MHDMGEEYVFGLIALLDALLELAAKMWDRDRSWTYLHTTHTRKELLGSQELTKKKWGACETLKVCPTDLTYTKLFNKCGWINIYIYTYMAQDVFM
jgi:hypothetical protein